MYESGGKLLLDVSGVMFGYSFFDSFKDGFAIELLGAAEVNRKEDFFDKYKTIQMIHLSVLIEESSETEMKGIPDSIVILLLDLQLHDIAQLLLAVLCIELEAISVYDQWKKFFNDLYDLSTEEDHTLI